jgi:stage V sporulation protein G
MEITEIRIKLMDEPRERLKAFCSITLDDAFVIRDLKIIDGVNGPFVAMPSRKLTAKCSSCSCKNHVRASFCNQCGVRLRPVNTHRDDDGRPKLYADIAHPINQKCREMIQQRLVEAFAEESVKAKLPGYVCRYDDYDYTAAAHDEHEGDGARTFRVHPPHDYEEQRPARRNPTRRDGFGSGVFDDSEAA